MNIVLYHGHCPDGWVAAFVAKLRYPEAELVPLDHGTDFEPVISSLQGKDVLMVDFSFKTREQNIRASQIAKSFRILDHHETAQDKLEGLDFATFDMKRSGAGLAWDYLFGKNSVSAEQAARNVHGSLRPWWVEYTEVRDIWQWARYEDSRQVAAYLGTLKFEFEDWANLELIDKNRAAELGRGALAHIEHYVREASKRVQYGYYDGLKVGVANVTYLNCSELGNEIAKTADFSLTWFEREDEQIQFSLRSIGDLNVANIAKKFAGGGHKNAAGFTLSIASGRNLVDTILGRNLTNAGPRHE